MALWACSLTMSAQRFFNLTAQEVRIDSLLPQFTYAYPVGKHYADSTFAVSIEYPEFIPMSEADVRRYHSLSSEPLKAMPDIEQRMAVSRKEGQLYISFVPLVYRDGQYQKLVSFMLDIKGKATSNRRRAASTGERYADNSVLKEGTWVKIRIPSTGIYQLTDDLIRRAGFSSLSKVKIYGYGGELQPEKLTGDYLTETDDLTELPTCEVGGRRLFYGVGPVSWDSNHLRVRNPYSNYGYYFLTENDDEPAVLTQEVFLQHYYPTMDNYCSLYEVDNYAWFHGGRNLYDSKEMTAAKSYSYAVASTGTSAEGTLTVSLSASGGATVDVTLNEVALGTVVVTANGSLEVMRTAQSTFNVSNLQASNTVVLTPKTGSGTVRLDYISTYATQPTATPDLMQTYGTPEIVGRITRWAEGDDSTCRRVVQRVLQWYPRCQRLSPLYEDALRQGRDGCRYAQIPSALW